ncbi:hypothetical protein [Streptomyces sp. TLI_105]|uniref:hypothetical protein n=1 Tax=Streptomyces sp. TLI_105 TaxID=1881019 RepID=UPI00115F84A4|nr:hypothetical protein [Streptomyces sp. TLI_105]
MSIPRAALLWWPLWIGLASWPLFRLQLWPAVLCLSAPLSVVLAVTFRSGRRAAGGPGRWPTLAQDSNP